jgi:hypothetical protein
MEGGKAAEEVRRTADEAARRFVGRRTTKSVER